VGLARDAGAQLGERGGIEEVVDGNVGEGRGGRCPPAFSFRAQYTTNRPIGFTREDCRFWISRNGRCAKLANTRVMIAADPLELGPLEASCSCLPKCGNCRVLIDVLYAASFCEPQTRKACEELWGLSLKRSDNTILPTWNKELSLRVEE